MLTIDTMSNLLLLAHPGSHPHPHDSDWLAVISDNPLAAIVLFAMVGMIVGLAWRAIEQRRD
jgi:hypothetical protein